MKILLVANTDWYLFNFRRSLAAYLRAAGHAVTLVSPRGPYVEDIQKLGFAWQEWPVGRKSAGPGELLALERLARIYARERPDLVHHFTVKPVLYGSLAANLAHVPRVVNAITGLGYVFLQNSTRARLLRQVVLLLYRLALRSPRQMVIFENTFDRDFFEGLRLLPSGAGRVIEGAGVDVELFTPTPEPVGTPLVVLPARMLWDKGVGTAVEAARLLRDAGTPLRLALVGATDPGNPANIPEATLQGWVAESCVEWWGFQEDMRVVYAQAAVVLLPSLGEGVPTVLIEAEACGRAIVTTNVAGCRDVVQDGVTGLLVPPNDPPALAAALHRLAGDPELRRQMGAAGRSLAEARFSTTQINRETLEVYQRLSQE